MKYSAELLDPVDRVGLLELWMQAVAGRRERADAEERYRWYFEQNPAGPPTVSVTRETETNALVACAIAFPHPTQVGGASHGAGVMVDFAVAKAHRVAGAALAVQRTLMNESLARFSIIYGCPNEKAEPIFKRLAYKIVARTTAFMRVMRTERRVQRQLGTGLGARLLSALADRVLALPDARVHVMNRMGCRGEHVDRADARFDELWTRARRHYGITGERSAAYLNWRYADCGGARNHFFAVTRPDGHGLAGYLIYRVEDGVVVVDDLFCDQPLDLLEVVLLIFVTAMRRLQFHSIYLSLVAGPSIHAILRRCLFIKRPEGRAMVARARPDAPPELSERLMDANQWFMVGGELDI